MWKRDGREGCCYFFSMLFAPFYNAVSCQNDLIISANDVSGFCPSRIARRKCATGVLQMYYTRVNHTTSFLWICEEPRWVIITVAEFVLPATFVPLLTFREWIYGRVDQLLIFREESRIIEFRCTRRSHEFYIAVIWPINPNDAILYERKIDKKIIESNSYLFIIIILTSVPLFVQDLVDCYILL